MSFLLHGIQAGDLSDKFTKPPREHTSAYIIGAGHFARHELFRVILENVCAFLWLLLTSFRLIASPVRARDEEDMVAAVGRARSDTHARPSAFHLRGTKIVITFFGRGSLSPRFTYRAGTPCQPCSLSFATGNGCSWQEASFVIVYLFCPGCVHIWQLAENKRRRGGGGGGGGGEKTRSGVVTLAARVMLRSFITSSNAAVSSACFWLCKAIFSLNFRGLFEVAMFRSSAPFSSGGQCQETRSEDARLPVRDVDTSKTPQSKSSLKLCRITDAPTDN